MITECSNAEDLALASAPLVSVGMASLAFAWSTTPERRGTLIRRRRDLRAPDGADSADSADQPVVADPEGIPSHAKKLATNPGLR
ncbi:MAG: hypothetical protein QOF06_2377 [Solirubrobacterales bacterium]|jgi:hypothetical protein|nr:hypothetical protein [Solirubrobacterales bacterium]